MASKKMEEYSLVNRKGTEMHMASQVSENYNKHLHREVRESMKKLCSWREESQKEFSYISNSIDRGINELIEEVCGLRVQLAVTTKERNDMIHTVGTLSGEIRKLSVKLLETQPLTNIVDSNDQSSVEETMEGKVTNTNEQDIETAKIDEYQDDALLENAISPKNQLDISYLDDQNNTEQLRVKFTMTPMYRRGPVVFEIPSQPIFHVA